LKERGRVPTSELLQICVDRSALRAVDLQVQNLASIGFGEFTASYEGTAKNNGSPRGALGSRIVIERPLLN